MEDDSEGSSPTESPPTSARLMAMRSTVLSKIPGGMESAMAQNMWNDSTPQVKAIRWLAEEDGLEVDPSDSEVLVQRYALAVIFCATGGKKRENKGWIKRLISCQT